MPTRDLLIDDVLSEHGLIVLGSFPAEQAFSKPCFSEMMGLLVGNAGPSMWRCFSGSAEWLDGEPDPLDRWTKRVLTGVSSQTGAVELFFPFEKPFLPFQKYMRMAAGARQSPLGLYIHSDYGFWYGLRGLLVYKNGSEFAPKDGEPASDEYLNDHPCDSCLTKPCLSTCPVGAFDGVTLDAKACRGYLDDHPRAQCHIKGCEARNACPVGRSHAYPDEQIRFHMQAYSSAKIA